MSARAMLALLVGAFLTDLALLFLAGVCIGQGRTGWGALGLVASLAWLVGLFRAFDIEVTYR